jgi:hypothetical protein
MWALWRFHHLVLLVRHPKVEPGSLPGLDIEIIHRRSPSGDAEQISINLQAVPSFEAFGRFGVWVAGAISGHR